MQTIVIILSILLFAAVAMIVATYLGKFKDTDKDGIPDSVEEFVDEKTGEVIEVVKKFTRKKPGRKKKN